MEIDCDRPRILMWGLGAMGSGMASVLWDNPGVKIVAAVDKRPSIVGKDLGELIGKPTTSIKVTSDIQGAFNSKPDIVLLSTSSFVKDVVSDIEIALKHHAHVLTIAEEMAYPWAASSELADRIDCLAKRQGKTVLGTGINPGFVLDSLIIALTGVCTDVKHIKGKRVNDLAPFGPTVMQTQGVGTTPEEFTKGVESGEIVGHVGFKQSLFLIGKTLGWDIDQVVEDLDPIITKVKRQTPYITVEPGKVAGCRHRAKAYSKGEEVICFEHPQQICPQAEGGKTGDYITITGNPPVSLAIEPEIPGGTGTIALAVNMVPLVLKGPSGLLTMADLPIPRLFYTPSLSKTRW